jgi:hypothetical protein
MSDSVTNPVGNAGSHPAAAGFQNAKVPLSDLFADVLTKTTFADRILSQSEFGLARAAERDLDARPDVYDAEPADAEPADDDAAEVAETDDHAADGDEAESENQAEGQEQVDGESGSQPDLAALPEENLLAFNGAPQDTAKPGLTVRPNEASGVELKSMTDGATPGQARVITTNGEGQAAAHRSANANNAPASVHEAMARGNADFGKAQSNAGVQRPDGATANPGLNVDGAAAKLGANVDTTAAKPGVNVDAAAAEQSQAKAAPVLPQAQSAIEGDAEGLGTSLERHAMLIRAGAKRAAELFQMKIRLEAHQKEIKKAIAQSSAGSHGAQPQSAAAGANRPSIEIVTNATPPAPAAYDGPAARPATLFNSPTPGSLPGQAGNGATTMLIGETVGNGAEQSAAAADRSAAASNTARGLGLRPTPAQVPFQPAEQVKVQIQQMVKSGADRIQIKLSPASLGRVEIALEISPDKAVQAIVYAEKPETLDMLERDARVLQQAFEEAGMKFGSDGLTFKHGQSGDADTELADGSGNTEDGAANGDEPEAGDSADNDSPRRRQHDGMLDLEI